VCCWSVILFIAKLSYLCNRYETPIKVFIDGTALKMDVSPVLKDGRTLVPLRSIGEALTAQVNWDESAKKLL